MSVGLLAAYTVLVILITMTPTPIDEGLESAITRLLEILRRYGLPLWFGYNKLEFTANVAMFVPLGFLVGLALPRRLWWIALLITPAFSTAIELAQWTALESRVGSALDVLANSIGGWIGVLTAFVLRAMVHARDERIVARAIWYLGRQEERR